ncbi:hypothetical protein MBM_03437 [Drepanopeziza brunnea f. sp. 'multigermtubi' MB_m1]|uniref:Histone deacetylase interacting domain-containing protein n=1 Tax=Marssonina brunnea f. sp. multigermtubi (strain MB_m1) TaxID=1072389 RepID=K1XZZ7_MARBU|nr:uncharacterized protein MBM_03437 [Drepanopeziza brunnea f. sp. 'multigermtubi' MB_m1]EKD18444.1 hypothetical protein MBM_03437 [Drepanopeziza brunnea f. sp. 'multigermtubi' MB_m1]
MNNEPHGPPGGFDQDRHPQEQRRVDAMREEQLQREREHERERERERNDRDRQMREQQYQQPPPPHQANTGPITIHQPVASRLPGAIHSPGGLLANHGSAPPSGPLGAPSGPGNAFGGPLHSEASRPIQHNPQQATNQLQQQQGFGPSILHHNSVGGPGGNAGFGGPLATQQQQVQQQQEAVSRIAGIPFGAAPIPQGHAIPGGAPQIGQGGQQPILNDALSYLDQVKVQFADQPDVYNRFLDIMKDFKSQAIDTPGVINRVSELFAGHPNLIQGFNTFLPPGYRIECGAGNDPNTIRVTTPMGTTVQSITGAGRALPESVMTQGGQGSGGYYNPQRTGNWQQQQQQPQHSIESPEAVFSPQTQNAVPMYNQTPTHSAYDQAAAAAAHQQQQRGVSQLTNAVASTLGQPPRNTQTPTPGGQPGMNNGAQAGLEKRGPVEFNHAISYVNKIKNRFQDRPEIYKQFLEILQTYQRESKPIQDVYAQVTTLFNTAPDLLEDFKQFLPESAAQAKAAAAAKAAEEAQQNQATQAQVQATRGEGKLPPSGTFSVPTSAVKDSNKKQGIKRNAQPSAAEGSNRGAGQGNAKRQRVTQTQKSAADAPAMSPTLTPQMPEPMPPTLTSGATSEELAFFDRVKKYIGNKQIMNEFLKLCNLFSQDLIDKNVLVHKVSTFIGGNPDLMNWFQNFVNYDGNQVVIDNQPQAPTNKVALTPFPTMSPLHNRLSYVQAGCSESACPNPAGPSGTNYARVGHGQHAKHQLEYELDSVGKSASKRRKLCAKEKMERGRVREEVKEWTKIDNRDQERLKPCSGRDEMCREVLNDDWASHPTWASEDSGFVAHRKNVYEEGLHRIEEERHDYDFNIETNAKVISLLEPIAQTLTIMDLESRADFRMPIGLGGFSQAIYKRVFKKIYGERGPEVVADLFKDPCAVLPIVLARLKQKDEEWRFTQREWEKVWAAQTSNMYLKSLDHMGIQAKQADKKNFAAKHLVDVIKTKYEEQRRQRATTGKKATFQLSFQFKDRAVVLDVLRIMLIYTANASQHNTNERLRIQNFFETFVRIFFGFSEDEIARCSAGIDRGTPDDDSEDIAPLELTNGRGRRPGNGKKNDLRRGVLDKGRNGVRGRGHKDDSATGSKESTPDVDSVAEDDAEHGDDSAINRVSEQRWMSSTPGAIDKVGTGVEYPLYDADQPRKRVSYSLYANQNIFCFFSIFQTLYRRLTEIKDCEKTAFEEGKVTAKDKPARLLGLISDADNFHISAEEDRAKNGKDSSIFYYKKTLEHVAVFIEGEMDESQYQNWLRRYYLKKGWQLYTVQDLLKSICRFGSVCSGSENKEKTPDLIELFYSDRRLEETTYKNEINLRKQADKFVKEQELFLISWVPSKKPAESLGRADIKWVQKDETTLNMNEMERKERWQYYVSSYVRTEPTEGVNRQRLQKSVLQRNTQATDNETNMKQPLRYTEQLNLHIDVKTFKIIYRPPGTDCFIYSGNPLTTDPKTKESAARVRLQKFENIRNERFREKFEMNNNWMKGLDHDEVARVNSNFKMWTEDGVFPNKGGVVDVLVD